MNKKIPTKKNLKYLNSLQITTIDLTAYCFLRTWFKYLIDHGFNVSLSTTIQQFEKEISDIGVKTINIHIARGINPISDLISLIRLYKLIKKEKYDIVQTYTTKAGFIGRIAAKLANTPIIIHNMLEPPHNSTKNPILRFLYIWMERIASQWADHIITTTQPNVKEILDKKLVPPHKLTAIPEGLVIEKYNSVKVDSNKIRKSLGIPPKAFFILTVARLEKAKGHTYLIEAAKKIVNEGIDAYFICLGKGNLMESLKNKTSQYKINDRVKFLGFRYDMLEILKSCDLFVLPSLFEGQGVVLMEAMAMKKPVIACNVGGVIDVVKNNETGKLIPPRNPEILAKSIKEIIKEPETMKKMGEKGYKRIKEHFKDSDFNNKRFEVYKKLFIKKLGIDIVKRIPINFS